MLNSVIIQGNLTKTPVLATGKSGKRYTKFRIACNQRYGTEQEVDYINCTCKVQREQDFTKTLQIKMMKTVRNRQVEYR